MTDAAFPWIRAYSHGLNWSAPLPTGAVADLLDQAAAAFPARPFMEFLGRRWSYAEGLALVNRVTAGLQSEGIGKGSRVGLMLPNCPYYPVAYYAILKTGATVVNFNPLYAERELESQVKDSGISHMVTLDFNVMYDKLRPLVGTTGLKRIIVCPFTAVLPALQALLFPLLKRSLKTNWQKDSFALAWGELLQKGEVPIPVSIHPTEDIAVLQYTGGTTGTPKGAMLTHANITANTEQCAHWFSTAKPGQESVLGVIPFFHVFAMTVVLNLGVKLAAEIQMLPRFEINQLLKALHKKRPTMFPAVPTIYNAILHHPKLGHYNLRSIRDCISGGAPLPLEVKQRFENLTGCKLVEGYGLSETSPVASCNPLQGINKPGSIGLPLPHTIFELMSLENPDVPAAPGERGELTIRGPQVMKGYWNKPEESAASLRQGRFHTGDVATMDEDGYFYIVDRIKDMIIASGYKIYPRHVEEAIYLHPAVAEVVVAGVPDDYRGQTVKAYVKLKDGATLTAEGLNRFLEDKISKLEIPKYVEFRDQLPKTMIGKLSRKALLDEEAAKAKK